MSATGGKRTFGLLSATLARVSNGELIEAGLQDALRLLWGTERPPLSALGLATVQDLQTRAQLLLPQAFAAYLGAASPSTDWMDHRGIIWWAPERIRSLQEECGSEVVAEQRNAEIEAEADSYIIFADFLDWCYAYAICCSDGPNRGKVALIGVRPDRFIASSFQTFVELAAAGSDRLHSPAGDAFTDLV